MKREEALMLKKGTTVIYNTMKWSSTVESPDPLLLGLVAGKVLGTNRLGGVHVRVIARQVDDWLVLCDETKEWVHHDSIIRVDDPPKPNIRWATEPRHASMAAPPLDPRDPMVTGILINQICSFCRGRTADIRVDDTRVACFCCAEENNL